MVCHKFAYICDIDGDIHKKIEKKLKASRKGKLFFLSDFRGLGSEAAIRQTFSRLTRAGKIKRLGQGIYLMSENDPVTGPVLPSLDKIASAIAEKDHARIMPVGAFALHKLGLSTQVPTRHVYLTNGPRRLIKVGKATIRFKTTAPKKLGLKGKLSALIILALEELGVESIDEQMRARIKELLKKENKGILLQDMKLASGRVSDYLFRLIKENEQNNRLAEARR